MADVCPKCSAPIGFRAILAVTFTCGTYHADKCQGSPIMQSHECRANRAEQAAKWLMTALAGCSVDNEENGDWTKQDIANVYAYASKKWPEYKP